MRTKPEYICDMCLKPIKELIYFGSSTTTIWRLELVRRSYDICGNCSGKLTEFIESLKTPSPKGVE